MINKTEITQKKRLDNQDHLPTNMGILGKKPLKTLPLPPFSLNQIIPKLPINTFPTNQTNLTPNPVFLVNCPTKAKRMHKKCIQNNK